MQWDDSTNAGFSSAKKEMLYIRQEENKDRPNAKQQMMDKYHFQRNKFFLLAVHYFQK